MLQRCKNIRANIVNIEISGEMSLFDELRILTGNVHTERCESDLWKAADWRRTDQWKNAEAAHEQQSTEQLEEER